MPTIIRELSAQGNYVKDEGDGVFIANDQTFVFVSGAMPYRIEMPVGDVTETFSTADAIEIIVGALN